MSAFLLRPRFLPDRDSQREWGAEGALIARLIRKGFHVPPTAAFGLSEVERWLEGIPGYAEAIEVWRRQEWADKRLPAFREAIMAMVAPEHWTKAADTIRRLLCGEQDWPLVLRSSVLASGMESVVITKADASELWEALKRIVASAFTEASAGRLLAAGINLADFRAGVLVQPCMHAEQTGTCRSDRAADFGNADGRFLDELRKCVRTSEKFARGSAELEWVWDGEQLWFIRARPVMFDNAQFAARGSAWVPSGHTPLDKFRTRLRRVFGLSSER